MLSRAKHLHEDVVPLHDATEVLVGGEDAVKAVVVDVSDNHLPRMFEKTFRDCGLFEQAYDLPSPN